MKGVYEVNEKLVLDYSVACTNLYGVVPIEKVVEIYNEQNEEQISLETVESFFQSERVKQQLEDNFVYIEADEFVAEATSESDEKAELKKAAAGKPYYIPDKAELLEFTEEEYFEQTPEQLIVKDMLREDFGDEVDAEEEVAELVLNLQVSGGDFMTMLSMFTAGLELPIEKAERYIPFIVDIADTTRLWENRGHTMKELQQL